jgi:type VI protein secretion system component Hcp
MAMYLDLVSSSTTGVTGALTNTQATPPGIMGESQSPNPSWNQKVEIETMSYSVSQSTSQQAGTGLVSSGSRVGHLFVTKVMDKSTPILFSYLCSGNPIGVMFIRVSRPGASGGASGATGGSTVSAGGAFGGLFEAETYQFQNVIISSYSTSGSPGSGGLPQESWAFSFTFVQEIYVTVDNMGNLKPAMTAGFDFGKSTAV